MSGERPVGARISVKAATSPNGGPFMVWPFHVERWSPSQGVAPSAESQQRCKCRAAPSADSLRNGAFAWQIEKIVQRALQMRKRELESFVCKAFRNHISPIKGKLWVGPHEERRADAGRVLPKEAQTCRL